MRCSVPLSVTECGRSLLSASGETPLRGEMKTQGRWGLLPLSHQVLSLSETDSDAPNHLCVASQSFQAPTELSPVWNLD